jgi:hypothetical protein
VLVLWHTIVGEYVWNDAEAHNERLARRMLEIHREAPARGQGRTYPLLTHLFEDEGFDAIDIRGDLDDGLWSFICDAVGDYMNTVRRGRYRVRREHVTSIWPNVSCRGEYHRPHRHNSVEHVVVGTYYVQVPRFASRDEGSLGLVDPRNTLGGSNDYRRFYQEGEIRIPPRAGQLVLFPPHLLHYVAPHESSEPRISISFNVSICALSERAHDEASPHSGRPR